MFENSPSIDDLEDELCKYCPFPEEYRGTHGTPNGYVSCEGRGCKDAYDTFMEEYNLAD